MGLSDPMYDSNEITALHTVRIIARDYPNGP